MFFAPAFEACRDIQRCILMLSPTLGLIILIGGNRLNILLFFIVIEIYRLSNKRFNFSLLALNIYFGVQSIIFYININMSGRGYDFSDN